MVSRGDALHTLDGFYEWILSVQSELCINGRGSWGPMCMNPSLLPFLQPFINRLSEQATQVQQHSGKIMTSLLSQVLLVKEKWEVERNTICPYKILTFFFANTPHVDNDTVSLEHTELVVEYCKESIALANNMLLGSYGDQSKMVSFAISCFA